MLFSDRKPNEHQTKKKRKIFKYKGITQRHSSPMVIFKLIVAVGSILSVLLMRTCWSAQTVLCAKHEPGWTVEQPLRTYMSKLFQLINQRWVMIYSSIQFAPLPRTSDGVFIKVMFSWKKKKIHFNDASCDYRSQTFPIVSSHERDFKIVQFFFSILFQALPTFFC